LALVIAAGWLAGPAPVRRRQSSTVEPLAGPGVSVESSLDPATPPGEVLA
jgi:hypothetical protein